MDDTAGSPGSMPLSRRAALGLGTTAVAGALLTRGAAAQEATPAPDGAPLTSADISLAQARAAIDASVAKAAEIGTTMDIAIVDAGGNLVAHVRMDGAWLGSIDIAINKAYTARAFDLSTADLAEQAQPGQQFYGIAASNDNRIMIFAGGIPLQRDGRIVGAWVQDDDAVVRVVLAPGVDLPPSATAALDREAERLSAWLDGVRISNVYSSALMKGVPLP